MFALNDHLRQALRYRWPAVPILLATLVVAIGGLVIPVDTSARAVDRASRSTLPDQTVEDEPVEEPVDPAGLNPALQGIGFIGVTFMEDEYAVLLNLSAVTQSDAQDGQPELEAGLVRLPAGATLPDGRRLVEVSADSLTLANHDGVQEEHLLFGDWDESPD